MENELTLHSKIPYSKVRVMDESVDSIESSKAPVGKKPDIAKSQQEKNAEIAEKAVQQRLAEMQSRARAAWENFIKGSSNKSELTPEEIKFIEQKIKKGEMPKPQSGGASDPRFENFDTAKYESEPILGDLARQVREAGERGEITDDFLRDINRLANQAVGAGVNEERAREFMQDVISAQLGQQTPEEAIQNPQNGTESQQGSPLSLEELLKQRIDVAAEKKETRSSNPRSLQEVALSIINDEGLDRWGPSGTFPLLEVVKNPDGSIMTVEKRDARGVLRPMPALKVNKENFVRWFRERMMYHHINNSRDENLQLGNLVGITSEFGSTISVFSMDKDRAQYFKDENDESVDDEMADQMKNELWLFGRMRNYDLLYQKYMGSDEDLPKFLAQVHDLEEITLPHSLETIMTMPKDYGEKGDTSIGDGVRKAYEIYYYASDIEMLREVLGANSIFFKREGFEKAFRLIDNQTPDSEISKDAENFINSIFEGDKIKEKEFVNALNPFKDKNKPEFNKRIMREMVRLAIAEKYGLNTGIEETDLNERSLVRKDLEYAEAFAWVITRWTGAAARNDTSAIGFDAFTKTIKFRDYRKRQSAATRAGAFGNEYDLPVFKGLTADFFNGITVEKLPGEKNNITPFEVFRQISEVEDNPNLTEEQKKEIKEKLSKRLNFEQYIQRSYAQDHLNRAFQVFHSTLGAEELRLDEIVKRDPFQGLILDRGKFEEQVKEKFIKPVRYAFSTYGQLDLGKEVRVQVDGFGPNDMPVYKTMTMAESMFGPEVLKPLKPEAQKWYRDMDKDKRREFEERLREKNIDPKSLSGDQLRQAIWQEYLSWDGRSKIWKRAIMARIALQLKSHRHKGNGYQFFNEPMIEKFYEALESIRSMEIEEGGDTTGVSYDERFLSEDDIKWIRKMSDTTRGQLFLKDIVRDTAGWGATKGVWEGINIFFKDVFK